METAVHVEYWLIAAIADCLAIRIAAYGQFFCIAQFMNEPQPRAAGAI
jgi:hypothetical protein